MHIIDMENWPRRRHYDLFSSYDHPHFSLCARVNVHDFLHYVKQFGYGFTPALVYLLARVANDLPEFRQRIRGQEVIEHDVVHPSFTVLSEGDLFSFCTVSYTPSFIDFFARCQRQIAQVQQNVILSDGPEEDNLLFMTAIPWVSFTSFSHPMDLQPADSVPRIAWGKYFRDGDRLLMPLDVQVHHALMDGIHVGSFYTQFQHYLDHAESVLV